MVEFFHMGGYAFFVWGSYLVVSFCLVGAYLISRKSLNQTQQLVRSSVNFQNKDIQSSEPDR